jgi:predicted  nucleic acid-binding Zn-ribbon protein
MRQAMVENEEFFDQLQEAHDNLAERFERMEMALTNGAEVREKRAEQMAVLDRTNGELVLASVALRKDKLDLESQLHESAAKLEARTKELNDAARQLEVTVEEYTTHLADCDRRVAEMGVRLSEVNTLRSLLSLRESELEASQAGAVELREEMKGWESRMAEKDMVLQQLRDKVGTKQFEVDEGRIKAEGEMAELRAKLDEALQEREELMEQVSIELQVK